MRCLTAAGRWLGDRIDTACRLALLLGLGIRCRAARIREDDLAKQLFIIDDKVMEAEEALRQWRLEQTATETAIDDAWRHHSRLWEQQQALRRSISQTTAEATSHD